MYLQEFIKKNKKKLYNIVKSQVLWSDESKFNLFGSNGIRYARRPVENISSRVPNTHHEAWWRFCHGVRLFHGSTALHRGKYGSPPICRHLGKHHATICPSKHRSILHFPAGPTIQSTGRIIIQLPNSKQIRSRCGIMESL